MMKKNSRCCPGAVLLSFDVEEFDLPKEHGADIAFEEEMTVSANGLEEVLKVLDCTGVRATFFITGNFAKARPDLVLKIKDDRHEIACHGVDHSKASKSDARKSKDIIEEVAGVSVTGYRQPRMFEISYEELKKCGYCYDSSINPTFVPGRYNHFNISRKGFKSGGVVEVPTSVATVLRIPLFWLALHILPFGLYVRLAKMSIKKTGFFATYFHPWEFAEELRSYKMVPSYIKHNSGRQMGVRLKNLIIELKKYGCEFISYGEYVGRCCNQDNKEVKKMKKIRERIGLLAKENKCLLRPFLVLSLIYLVGISAIILAKVHYADDNGRTLYGYHEWLYFSRYISELVSWVLHTDEFLANIAPLPQILSVLVLSLSSIMLICIVAKKEIFEQKVSKWIMYVIAVIPLGLSPYMLECLSYQYDSIYMALSVFFAIFPFLFREKTFVFFLIVLAIGILGVCMTYQSAIGIIPMLIVFLAIRDWNDKKMELNKDRRRAFARNTIVPLVFFCIMLILYLKLLTIPRDVYASNTLLDVQNFFPGIINNLIRYITLMLNDFKVLWLVLVFLSIFSFIFVFVNKSKRNKILSAVVSLVGIMLMFLCAFVVYASLSKPLFTPRTMYAVGVFLAILCIYVIYCDLLVIFKVPIIMIAWCFFVFAFTYGNALLEQQKYVEARANIVLADLNNLNLISRDNEIWITGYDGISLAIEQMSQDYLILRRLLNVSFGQGWAMRYFLCSNSNMQPQEYEVLESDYTIIKETSLYDIMVSGNNILVKLKDDIETTNLKKRAFLVE